jgi:hypothetical protein
LVALPTPTGVVRAAPYARRLYVAQGYVQSGVAPYGQELGSRYALLGLATALALPFNTAFFQLIDAWVARHPAVAIVLGPDAAMIAASDQLNPTPTTAP